MTAARARLAAMVTFATQADRDEFDSRVENVVVAETRQHVLANRRDAVQAQMRIAQLERALCQCEPEREHADYSMPAEYVHAADCAVTAALQVAIP
ncbi:hypothetical protein OG693_39295 (plasmid) [Streptomyces sp. NBC_01259]|uniref:hypothetical protein n=1 Tax=Streptomyces sp. NBC_01259 TaxID=2903800 RepID=UPI00324F213E